MAKVLSKKTVPATAAGRAAGAGGFRPSSRSRARIVAGVVLAAVSVLVILVVFSTVDKRSPVLQLVRDVPAGEMITATDFRVVDVSVDSSVEVVSSSLLNTVVGEYAKVRLASGALLTLGVLQHDPLVAAGSSVVAVTVGAGELPAGVRERSRVSIVFTPVQGQVAPAPVVGRVVGVPKAADSVTGQLTVSIEVSVADGVTVASASKVRLVLLDPGVDPATDSPTGSVAPAAGVVPTVPAVSVSGPSVPGVVVSTVTS